MYDFYLSANFKGEKIGLDGYIVYIFCEIKGKSPFVLITKDNIIFQEFRLDKNMPKKLKIWVTNNYKLLLKVWNYKITYDQFFDHLKEEIC